MKNRRKQKRKDEKKQNRQGLLPLPAKLGEVIKQTLGNRYSFNFGLYYNKWLEVEKNSMKCDFGRNGIIESYELSKNDLGKLINRLNNEIDEAVKAFKKIGFKTLFGTKDGNPEGSLIRKLKSPLIVGLGNANPTERGFTFHWSLGIPYIPSNTIKGVVRLAYLVNCAEDDPKFFEHWECEDATYLKAVEEPFGYSERNRSKRGEVMFLDAIPVEVPELTLEITTCHYHHYYSGERGPTEDQNPRPLLFLAVKSGTPFRFTCLVSRRLKDETVVRRIRKAFEKALEEHGFGAKTAFGHGKFCK